jgi:pimeloyl-ACP methyl ester carboxylesterase
MSEIESRGENNPEAPSYEAYAQYQVTLNGYRTHYVDVGDGPPVVLVHGSPLSSYSFRHQIAALSPHFRVVAPDLPGFGKSQVPEEGASFLRQSENLRVLLDELDLDPFRLLVHDWGGPVGLGAVADRPERVCQLVLVNTTLRGDFRPPPYWKLFTANRLGDLLIVNLKLFNRGLPFMMRAARTPEVRRHYARSLDAKGTRRTMLALERLEGFSSLMERVERAVREIHVPTLILWGHPDPYFRRDELEQMQAMFPHAVVREIPNGGHFPQEDAPEAVSRELLEFLQ